MPCYHPLIRAVDTSKFETAKDGHKYHPARVFNPEQLEQYDDIPNNWAEVWKEHTLIPCGKCIGCRLDYSREWANRGYLELKHYSCNWFVTITYDEAHKPTKDEILTSDGFTYTDPGDWNGTLNDKDLTRFVKNVRQIMQRKYEKDLETWKEAAHKKDPRTPKKPKKPHIRFMACGEYGEEGERPHYHIIFFNLRLPISDLYDGHLSRGSMYYKSHIIEQAWSEGKHYKVPKGIHNISEATWANIAYTARYITKKINGEIAEHHYAELGQEKEFFRVSRMPGIGECYYSAHKKEIYELDEVIIRNKHGSVACRPPKYFDRLYEKENPEAWKKIKENRKKRAVDLQKVKDMDTSLLRLAQLEVDERAQESKNLQLIREFEKKKPVQ